MVRAVPPGEYGRLIAPLDSIPFNTYFARTVLAGHLPGKVVADGSSGSETALVRHPYGMSLLFGSQENARFNSWLKGYMLGLGGHVPGHEWLQVHPASWKPVIEGMLGDGLVRKNVPQDMPTAGPEVPGKVMEYSRVNFRFDPSLHIPSEPPPWPVVRTDRGTFETMPGQVIPRFFWRDWAHFERDGIGYTAMAGGGPAATAFAAFVHGRRVELGIETLPGFRGKGCARAACSALIKHCIERGLEPVWSCRLENEGSFRLAKRLGFEPSLYLPYYQLAGRH